MGYKTHFVGLAYFQEEPAGTERVLLPDGRNLDDIPPHLFSISVAPDRVMASTGWGSDQIDKDKFHTQFWPPPSNVTMSGADAVGKIDTSQQALRLPSLSALGPNAKVDFKKAKCVGDFAFRQGTFTAFRRPKRPLAEAALVSSLELEHKGDILITLTERADPSNPAAAEGTVRTITLKPDTEIVVVNASRNEPLTDGGRDHALIYLQLLAQPVAFSLPQVDAAAVDELQSDHPFFIAPNAAFQGPGCSNMQG